MIQEQDLLAIERGGVQYQATAAQVADFVGAIRDFTAATFTEFTSLGFPDASEIKIGDRVFVADASGDSTVDTNNTWAIYRITTPSPLTYNKIKEQESLDLIITAVSHLSYAASPSQGEVVNSAGDNAIIPLATGTNAGLMPPAAFNNIHSPAIAALTPATNPITVNESTQGVGFSIAQLAPLP